MPRPVPPKFEVEEGWNENPLEPKGAVVVVVVVGRLNIPVNPVEVEAKPLEGADIPNIPVEEEFTARGVVALGAAASPNGEVAGRKRLLAAVEEVEVGAVPKIPPDCWTG